MEDLKDIIKEIKSYKSKDFKPSDDAILTCSTMIFLDGDKKQNTPVQKTKSNSQKKSFKIKDPTAPATEAQRSKLNELKVKYPNNLTKGEADQLIKESLKNGSSQEEYADY
jgi:hypothetical protein